MKRFPTIYDFDELDTIPMGLHNLRHTETNDPRSHGHWLLPKKDPIQALREDYPRIMKQIEMLWGTKELQERFTHWLVTDQEGRKGWPKEITAALIQLSNMHAEHFNLEGGVKWGGKPDRW